MKLNPLATIRTLVDLVGVIVDLIHRGEPERIEAILPTELRVTLERRIADERARHKFAARTDETKQVIRDA